MAFGHPQTLTANAKSQVFANIKHQLKPLGVNGPKIKVNGVDVYFCDGGAAYVLPVYRFYGTLKEKRNNNKNETVATVLTGFVGHLSIGPVGPEAIPTFKQEEVGPPIFENGITEAGGSSLSRRSFLNYFEVQEISHREPNPEIHVARSVVHDGIEQWH